MSYEEYWGFNFNIAILNHLNLINSGVPLHFNALPYARGGATASASSATHPSSGIRDYRVGCVLPHSRYSDLRPGDNIF
jgi:hypothetical protein